MPVMTTERTQRLAELTNSRPEQVREALELTEMLVDAARSVAKSATSATPNGGASTWQARWPGSN